jgi:hypothetical protein
MMSEKMNSVWSKLDRKATAIAEFTMRQYRTRISTWVVLGVGLGSMLLVALFYADAMNTQIEAIDNDQDSYDWDGDGYPTGQEVIHGTDPYNSNSYPIGIEPDPREKWINEDDFNWDNASFAQISKVGYDDDGDCRREGQLVSQSQKDNNGDSIPCNIVLIYSNYSQVLIISSDGNVDEDPDDEKYAKEALHRAFILGVGKMGIVYLLGIFLPLFLATGLIRDEMTNGTMHFMIAKPIARGEILVYRMLGYLGIVWPFLIGLCLLMSLLTGFMGPSESFFRLSDLAIWFTICIAAMLVTLVYGAIFSTFGILWKQGVVLAIILAAWELGMAFVSVLAGGDSAIQKFSVIGWGLMIVDAGAAMTWPDMAMFIEMGEWVGKQSCDRSTLGDECGPLIGSEPLRFFSSGHGLGVTNWVAALIASLVLIFQAAAAWFIGQSLFKGKEMDD